MTIKITTPNGGSDSLDFGCAQTPVVATVTGTEVSSGEGKLELKTTTGGTSATKATILANGRVGIGTATVDEALQVNGAIKVTAGMATDTASTGAMGYQNSKYRFISWGADTSTKGAYGFEGYSSNGSVNATHLAIDATGNVGIGVTNPDLKMEIVDTSSGASKDALLLTNYGAASNTETGIFFSPTEADGAIRGARISALNDGANDSNSVALKFSTGLGAPPVERMRITSAGDVGIGTTAPDGKVQISSAALGTTATNSQNLLRLFSPDTSNNTTYRFYNYRVANGSSHTSSEMRYGRHVDATEQGYVGLRDGAVTFGYGTAESMRIDSSGNVLVGTTTLIGDSSRLNISYTYTNSGIGLKSNTASAHNAIMFTNTNGTVGTITTSGSSTAYNTSSDYRLKENVQYEWSATERLKKLKPAQFNFLSDPDNTVDGFLAHEAQEVVPEAVTGVKDEVDDDDKPVMQGIDQSKLVPLLVKTIQELEARIAKLEEDK